MTIKIFIGNLGGDTTADDVRALFEKYGSVVECDVLKNYGFVHMNEKSEANAAIANLDGYNLKGQRMRVELSTGKKGNPKGDRRGGGGDRGGRSRPYPPGPPRRGGLPPPDYDRFDPYFSRYPYPERDPYYRLPPADPYLARRLPPPPGDRYDPLPLPRDRLLPGERGSYPPDPRDRLLARERLPPYPEDRAYDRLRAPERAPLASDPYFRERSPPASRPPPEYYDRKPALMRTPGAAADQAASARLNTTAYPSANGYDFYRRPGATAERSDYGAQPASQDYYGTSRAGAGSYDRAGAGGGAAAGAGAYGMQQQQSQSKPYDSQSALQTQPIFF